MSAALLAPVLSCTTLQADDLRLLPPIVGTTEQRGQNARSGLGLGGHDPLSYFLEDAPRQGRAELEVIWGGLAWRFVSSANRAAFLRDPDAFLPRAGGYDALAAAADRAVDANPAIFARTAGRIYLFRSEERRRRFLGDADHAAAAAEAGWLRIRGDLIGS